MGQSGMGRTRPGAGCPPSSPSPWTFVPDCVPEREVNVRFCASAPRSRPYTVAMKGLREFIDWLREALKGSPQPQPVPIPVRVRERR
ncbi:hypothetical protein DAETH_20060 [Deinococcus aetherius]|uniref:Uncharacterized protein n=1 Tax=Deinococcus aetherius TaxID=200252 RepID=A0ABM8AE22_9DEIO|nr:hypothetical protein DAETH_20060 [Deinococcus aetherius]